MSGPPSDIESALTPVVEAFEQLAVRYYIGGSLASSAHGVARATMDVDLVADLKPAKVTPLVGLLQEQYYIDGDALLNAIACTSVSNLVHLTTMMKIDVYMVGSSAFDQASFARHVSIPLGVGAQARKFVLATPEDTILHKLRWFKAGGEISQRQWSDVLGVLKVQADGLQLSYLQTWAHELGIAYLLDRAMNEASRHAKD